MNESPLKSWDSYVRTARVYMELTAQGCCTARTVHEPVPMQNPGSLVSERPKPYLDWLAQSRWGSQLPAPARPTQSSEPIVSRSYGSGLPTSLTYIVLLTKGCSPWRPAAVMGTTWGDSLHSSPGFSRASQTPNTVPDAALSYPVGFRQTHPLQRKDNSSRGSNQRLGAS